MRFKSLLLAVVCASSAFGGNPTFIVDVIPTKLNKEHQQNSEPNIAVNLPPARVKASGNTVYVAFERPATFDGFNDPLGDIVIVRVG